MKKICHISGTETDINLKEDELIAKNYRRTNKTNDKDLEPYEYIKRSFSGSAESFEGTTKYQLTWLE